MNQQLAFTKGPIAAVGCSFCLLGLCLLTGGGCNESHAPAMASPTHAAPTLAFDDKRAADDKEKVIDVEPPAAGPTDAPAARESVATPATPFAPATPIAPAAPPAMRDITFDALKFDIKAGDPYERSMIPRQTEGLHGKPIRIRGYIHPQFAFMETGLTEFILTRDSNTCCFGPNRALCDFIVVRMNPGKTANYSLYPIAVEGVFAIKELVDPIDPQRAVGAIYRLDAEAAR